MCAITGFIDHNNSSDTGILKQMINSMHHRGPDGEGQVILAAGTASVGMGHKRLSILDLSPAGQQPMEWEGRWICFNGEVYNYKEIKMELEGLGHVFRSHSDTEVILHAYGQWKEKCLDKFTGMFAFCIYDTHDQTFFCARDRAGVKPFYYYCHKGLFLFASELKAFHEHPSFIKKIDTNAVALFMQFGNIPAPYSIFEHTFKLKPGHYFTFKTEDLRKGGWLPEPVQYWNVYDAYNSPKLEVPFEEAKEQTEKVLQKAFEYRMVSDVPVGVFLSGGYDSACVTALLQKDRTERLKTYTIAVPDIGLNEAPYAKEVADYLGTDHTEAECSQKEAMDLIPNLPFYYDEPFGDSSAVPTSLVCQVARKHVTVALSADAGDEVFAGYNRYDYLMRFGSAINSIPSVLRKGAASVMNVIPAESIPVLKNKYNFSNRYEKLKGILKNPSPEQIMWSLSRQFDEKQLAELILPRAEYTDLAYHSKELKPTFYSPLSYMMAVDYQTYLPDDILTKVDRASMSASLEGREPFLDHNVIEWAARLPDHFKYNKGIKKYILREIVHQYIPHTMMDRPKMGFAVPFENWMMTDLKEQVLSLLSPDHIRTQGIFNTEYVRNLTDRFFNGKKELGLKIWYLYMFQLWYNRWMK